MAHNGKERLNQAPEQRCYLSNMKGLFARGIGLLQGTRKTV